MLEDRDLCERTPMVLLPPISGSETMAILGLAMRCEHRLQNVSPTPQSTVYFI